jgi:hypothetical protein
MARRLVLIPALLVGALVLGTFLSLDLPSAARGEQPALPVATMTEVQAALTNARVLGACDGTVVVNQAFLRLPNGVEYGLVLIERRFVLYETREGDNTPVWIGRVLPDGALQVRETLTYGELLQRYPSVCDFRERGV